MNRSNHGKSNVKRTVKVEIRHNEWLAGKSNADVTEPDGGITGWIHTGPKSLSAYDSVNTYLETQYNILIKSPSLLP